MCHNQIVHHKTCFNLFILHKNLFHNQGSEINENDLESWLEWDLNPRPLNSVQTL